ncbi:zinc-binding dehydrogenase [Curvibacter lanceolatus]|jgi:NADPH2:quinone reductase|uniref:zinc-binding dehydrogenase n=1 Tax=Curvibacter lanceolatus TaxID=86182 RepID=UPI00036FD188|nr:zinc-binding dehydrogenase [Curvibacter lanceolatus]
MNHPLPATALQLRSLIHASGELEISLVDEPLPVPGEHEVLIRIEATPLNPSDQGLLLGPADLSTVQAAGSPERPVLKAQLPAAAMPAMAARVGQSLAVGNEGAGTVVAAGDSAAAQALLGKKVAAIGGAMYAQYRCVPLSQCLLLPDDATAAEGASCFVNPLTALGMVETMRREGHTALVHTAAASNLGQMLNRICLQDGIGLVNIVRSPAQAALLRGQGAVHVCDSSADSFSHDLTEALVQTGATLAFDATGGGTLAGQILSAMEVALNRNASEYSRYGSPVHKQVYLYGGLDTSPTTFRRNFGMAWGMGGWLLFPFLNKIGPAGADALKQRVARELRSTFRSHYAGELSLTQALAPEQVRRYAQRATGEKFLIKPN